VASNICDVNTSWHISAATTSSSMINFLYRQEINKQTKLVDIWELHTMHS